MTSRHLAVINRKTMIIQLREAGLTHRAIADRLGLCENYVREVLHKVGIRGRVSKRKEAHA